VHFDEDDLLPCEDILSVCAGIVIHDVASRTIRLVHYTTEEYFRDAGPSMFAGADPTIATLSIRYILKLIHLNVLPESIYVYATYAVRHWQEHLHGHEDNTAIATAKAALLDSSFLSAHADVCGLCLTVEWQSDDASSLPSDKVNTANPAISGLHVCASHGFEIIASGLLSCGVNPSIQSQSGKQPSSPCLAVP
jgi:hypothetical protein